MISDNFKCSSSGLKLHKDKKSVDRCKICIEKTISRPAQARRNQKFRFLSSVISYNFILNIKLILLNLVTRAPWYMVFLYFPYNFLNIWSTNKADQREKGNFATTWAGKRKRISPNHHIKCEQKHHRHPQLIITFFPSLLPFFSSFFLFAYFLLLHNLWPELYIKRRKKEKKFFLPRMCEFEKKGINYIHKNNFSNKSPFFLFSCCVIF